MGKAAKESNTATKTAGDKVMRKCTAAKKGRPSRRKAAAVDKEAGTPVVKNVKEKKQRPVADIQKHADIETRRAFRQICEGLLEHARKGAIPQAKLLIHIGKLEEKPSGRKRMSQSLSAILMEELRRSKAEENSAATAEQHAETDGIQETT